MCEKVSETQRSLANIAIICAMEEQMPNSWLNRLLREHPALAITGLYVLASIIGLMFSWAYLREFGINVFRYAEIGDFLLASLKEPFTWVVAVFAVFLVMMDNAWSRRVHEKGSSRYFRWYGSKGYRLANYAVGLIMAGMFLYLYASYKYNEVVEGRVETVYVTLSDGSDRRGVVLLDTTGRFLFLYDRQNNRVYIHPHENVLTIRKDAPSRRAPSSDGDH